MSENLQIADLQRIAKSAIAEAIVAFKEPPVKSADLAVSIAILDRAKGTFVMGDVNGDVNMYPASVVKMFYAGYLARLLDQNKVKRSVELDRAVKDMLFESSNDATGLVLDVITGTTGGAELPANELKVWMDKRQAVNKWLQSMGYTNQNACQKTWNEGPYGRERQGYGPNFELRNSLSANAITRFMSEIVLNKIASKTNCDYILQFMKRSVDASGVEAGGQTKGYIGEAVSNEWPRWSKAGWAYQVRHDVCWMIGPDGREVVLTIYTDHHGSNAKLLPAMARSVIRDLGWSPKPAEE